MYDFREVSTDPEGIAACAALLRAVFPAASQYSDRFVDWEYRLNPAGGITGFNAWQAETLVAHYVAQPLLARVDGHEERGLLSLNTATHPEHQGKKLFTTLATRTYELAASKGYGFVVGVANANSTPGFIGRLGFQLVGRLNAKIGVGRIRYVARPSPASSFERVWSRELLTWRLANPEGRYTVRGENVLASAGKPGIRVVLGRFDRRLLEGLSTSGGGPSLLKVWLGLDRDTRWGRSFYMEIPMRLRPSPLNLIFLDLTGKGRKLLADATRFQAIDFDPY